MSDTALTAAANVALARTDRRPLAAVEGFTDEVMANPALLVALMRNYRPTVRQIALSLLERLADPVHVNEHTRSAPGKAPPKAKAIAPKVRIGKGAAHAVATSIYDREIGSGKFKIGALTKFDIMQIHRRGMIDSTVAQGLLDRDWPDERTTTVRELIPEDQLKACFERAYRVLDSLGITTQPAAMPLN